MTFLVPFMYQPAYSPDKTPYLVYAVNQRSPEKTSGFIQGYWSCTDCGKGNQFRFYDDGPNYRAKCPECKNEFIAVDDSELDE